MISFPNAKINIGLNIVSKRVDGYHNLETIFYPVHISDILELVDSKETKLSTSGIFIAGNEKDNLVLKAFQILNNEFQLPPVSFHLHKTVPFGAGLGGGSSDAAFALKMLNDFFELKLSTNQLKTFAAKIGADCSFFIENKPTFATGIGDQLQEIDLDLSEYKIVLVKPGISVSTPEAYRNVIPQKPGFSLKEINKISIEEWKNAIVNDFEQSIFLKYPEIKKIKETLYEQGALYSSMSGSGSAVFGIFRHLPANLDKYLPKGIFIYR